MMVNMEQSELSYTIGENAKRYNRLGKQFGNFLKTIYIPTVQHTKKKENLYPQRLVCNVHNIFSHNQKKWEKTQIMISMQWNTVAVVQSLHHIQLFVTPWTAAHQASLSFTISQSLLKLMFIQQVMPSNHLILCHPFLLLPSIFPSIRVFSNELTFHIRQPKYWSFSFSISPSNEYSLLIEYSLRENRCM